jgi:demethylmenaquinone methyltransferase/2-methoxy-6-polyprenyl-1,4-benzoquinol methylase
MFEKNGKEVGALEKTDVIAFFDRCAGTWDAETIRNEDVIRTILDNAAVRSGIDVLDVACGTGVLFPDYFARRVASVTGIDISPGMASRAREKFPQATVLCADAETYPFRRDFDTVMVYNALPHFPEPGRLIEALAPLVRKDGRLSVAHGMSRAMLARHHSGAASGVSVELPEAEALAEMFAPWFDVDVVISDDRMYQVAGRRR